ncbi:penicillin-binding transpeptidase domain-containing protein [Labedaea rhizosphaerae]|uniref:MecA-like transpeptidase family protein n=1 Tax=Labedaea rhizosphaerae TaxID=598644 RepID=A0A4R6SCE1_LABRH|nr:penicillin-binding transpeptidase domain-containing protein [Labedaea rhizosphaerae]TDP97207.1 MecA-like transpeptidase family protein [Labedaea rhizosphaerae]
MTRGRKRAVLAVGIVVFVGIVVAAVVVLWPKAGSAAQTDPNAAADAYLTAFGAGDAKATGALTDAPAAATAQLTSVWQGLHPKSVQAVRVSEVQGTTAPIRIVWELGDHEWTYDSKLSLVKNGDGWLVHWAPALIHPKLKTGQTLRMRTQTGTDAVLDRDGKALLTWTANGPKAVDSSVAPLLLDGMARVAEDQGTKQAGAWHVALVDKLGKELATLYKGGDSGDPVPALHSTLDRGLQKAAQDAVDSVGKPAELIAIVPSTGDIVAVAQNKAAGKDAKVLHGLYPPGSTFKIVTSTAAFGSGEATASTVRPCPGEATVGTRHIRNEGFELGDVPLHEAFAHSCNTTFAALAKDLPTDALPDAASSLGLGADFAVPGITTVTGAVPPAGSSDEQVEDGIGQGKVVVSPFGMALVCATVQSGKAVTPRLWTGGGPKTAVQQDYQPPSASVLGPLRPMMREVVTGGTAKGLRGSGTVFGKTGTAQFGDGSHSHGWFAGYRGDLAFAVLVTDAGSSSVAVSVTGEFLSGAD